MPPRLKDPELFDVHYKLRTAPSVWYNIYVYVYIFIDIHYI